MTFFWYLPSVAGKASEATPLAGRQAERRREALAEVEE